MDATFPDLMRQLGEIDDDKLTQRWVTIEALAKQATREQVARMVGFAHREPISRSEDEWFWQPFRADEVAFPIEDGVELHARLAAACIQSRILGGQQLDARLVRLANLMGLVPATPFLTEAASDALIDAQPEQPKIPAVASGLFDEEKVKATLAPGVTPDTVIEALKLVAGPAFKAVTTTTTALRSFASWADATHRHLDREQRVTQWLLRGTRADGQPWESLPAEVVAIDAAAELGAILDSAPQARHEATLVQVITLARTGTDPIVPSKDAEPQSRVIAAPACLTPFTPIHGALAQRAIDGLPPMSPAQLALRFLWEETTIAAWVRGS